MIACACMGIAEGDIYCYCEMKRRGMNTSHYEWTEQEKEALDKALSDLFGIKEEE